MIIRNETTWDTAAIRAIAKRVAEEELDPFARKGLTIRVGQGRKYKDGVHGHAWLGTVRSEATAANTLRQAKLLKDLHHIEIWMPTTTVESPQLAWILAHEMAHARGMDHPMMKGGKYDDYNPANWAWATAIPVLRKELKPLPDPLVAKIAHANEMVRIWKLKVGVAERRVAKWTRLRDRATANQERSALKAAASPLPSTEAHRASYDPTTRHDGPIETCIECHSAS